MNAHSLHLALPDHFEDAVGNDEHLSGHFASAANHVARRENRGAHFEHQIVKKLRLALLEDAHLITQKKTKKQKNKCRLSKQTSRENTSNLAAFKSPALNARSVQTAR